MKKVQDPEALRSPEVAELVHAHSKYGLYGLPPRVCAAMASYPETARLAQLGARALEILRDFPGLAHPSRWPKSALQRAHQDCHYQIAEAARALGLLGEEARP